MKLIQELQAEIHMLRSTLKQLEHYLNIMSTQKDISDKDIAFKLAKETVRVVLEKESYVD